MKSTGDAREPGQLAILCLPLASMKTSSASISSIKGKKIADKRSLNSKMLRVLTRSSLLKTALKALLEGN